MEGSAVGVSLDNTLGSCEGKIDGARVGSPGFGVGWYVVGLDVGFSVGTKEEFEVGLNADGTTVNFWVGSDVGSTVGNKSIEKDMNESDMEVGSELMNEWDGLAEECIENEDITGIEEKEVDCIEVIDENEWTVGSRDMREVDCIEVINENSDEITVGVWVGSDVGSTVGNKSIEEDMNE